MPKRDLKERFSPKQIKVVEYLNEHRDALRPVSTLINRTLVSETTIRKTLSLLKMLGWLIPPRNVKSPVSFRGFSDFGKSALEDFQQTCSQPGGRADQGAAELGSKSNLASNLKTDAAASPPQSSTALPVPKVISEDMEISGVDFSGVSPPPGLVPESCSRPEGHEGGCNAYRAAGFVPSRPCGKDMAPEEEPLVHCGTCQRKVRENRAKFLPPGEWICFRCQDPGEVMGVMDVLDATEVKWTTKGGDPTAVFGLMVPTLPEQAILLYLKKGQERALFLRARYMPPTLREIGNETRLRDEIVARTLHILRDKGLVKTYGQDMDIRTTGLTKGGLVLFPTEPILGEKSATCVASPSPQTEEEWRGGVVAKYALKGVDPEDAPAKLCKIQGEGCQNTWLDREGVCPACGVNRPPGCFCKVACRNECQIPKTEPDGVEANLKHPKYVCRRCGRGGEGLVRTYRDGEADWECIKIRECHATQNSKRIEYLQKKEAESAHHWVVKNGRTACLNCDREASPGTRWEKCFGAPPTPKEEKREPSPLSPAWEKEDFHHAEYERCSRLSSAYAMKAGAHTAIATGADGPPARRQLSKADETIRKLTTRKEML